MLQIASPNILKTNIEFTQRDRAGIQDQIHGINYQFKYIYIYKEKLLCMLNQQAHSLL